MEAETTVCEGVRGWDKSHDHREWGCLAEREGESEMWEVRSENLEPSTLSEVSEPWVLKRNWRLRLELESTLILSGPSMFFYAEWA